MRKVIEPQLALGQIDIAAIVFNPKSRDDIPQILRGLQHLYLNPDVRRRVYALLEEALPERSEGKGKVSPDTGRPGMAQWTILVLGVLRLGLNADYDRIHELANEHATLRQMLGWGTGRRTSSSNSKPSRTTCACSPRNSSTASTKR